MSLTELTGVLSHEFGHFRQGSGMRISQLIRRLNHWFARVVYERDEWDQQLVEWSQNESWFSLIALLGRFFVWLSRRVLWVLMVVGHGISSILMRQMEFDADQYEVLISGSDAFAQTALRLRTLTVANAMAQNEESSALRVRARINAHSWVSRRPSGKAREVNNIWIYGHSSSSAANAA